MPTADQHPYTLRISWVKVTPCQTCRSQMFDATFSTVSRIYEFWVFPLRSYFILRFHPLHRSSRLYSPTISFCCSFFHVFIWLCLTSSVKGVSSYVWIALRLLCEGVMLPGLPGRFPVTNDLSLTRRHRRRWRTYCFASPLSDESSTCTSRSPHRCQSDNCAASAMDPALYLLSTEEDRNMCLQIPTTQITKGQESATYAKVLNMSNDVTLKGSVCGFWSVYIMKNNKWHCPYSK